MLWSNDCCHVLQDTVRLFMPSPLLTGTNHNLWDGKCFINDKLLPLMHFLTFSYTVDTDVREQSSGGFRGTTLTASTLILLHRTEYFCLGRYNEEQK